MRFAYSGPFDSAVSGPEAMSEEGKCPTSGKRLTSGEALRCASLTQGHSTRRESRPEAMSEEGKCPTSRMAPAVGLEPTTLALTAPCSTIELHRNKIRRAPDFVHSGRKSIGENKGYHIQVKVHFERWAGHAMKSGASWKRRFGFNPETTGVVG